MSHFPAYCIIFKVELKLLDFVAGGENPGENPHSLSFQFFCFRLIFSFIWAASSETSAFSAGLHVPPGLTLTLLSPFIV